jgi:hypothetical protein
MTIQARLITADRQHIVSRVSHRLEQSSSSLTDEDGTRLWTLRSLLEPCRTKEPLGPLIN